MHGPGRSVWTFDAQFPFHHPEHPELRRVAVEAPIENEVAEMEEFKLKYAVLINPRNYGWDNSYISQPPTSTGGTNPTAKRKVRYVSAM